MITEMDKMVGDKLKELQEDSLEQVSIVFYYVTMAQVCPGVSVGLSFPD